MERIVTYEYYEKDVTPPGCRKARDVHGLHGTATIIIREIDPAIFPVAIEERYRDDKNTHKEKNYHWFEDSLWTRIPDHDLYAFERSSFGGFSYTLDNVKHNLAAFQENYILVSGIAYEQSYEPFYRVSQFRNLIMVSVYYPDISDVFSDLVFPANQPEWALACAERWYNEIGDDEEKHLSAGCHLHIIMPEALTVLKSSEVAKQRQQLLSAQDALIADYQEKIEACKREQARLVKVAQY